MKRVLTQAQKDRKSELQRIRRANRTPEEIAKDRAKQKIASAKYRATPEAKAKAKAYAQTPERKAAAKRRSAKYNAKPERKAAQKMASAKYYAKPEVKARVKARYESGKDGLYRVYMLKCGYVGQTSNIYKRMTKHKNKNNRDTSNYIVLHTVKTKAHALRLEAIYHYLDFAGVNARHKIKSIS